MNKTLSTRHHRYGATSTEIVTEIETGKAPSTIFTSQDTGSKETTTDKLRVRRVTRGPWSAEDYASGEKEFDEVQIGFEVSTFHHGSNRLITKHGSVSLRGDEIAALLAALQPKI